MSYVDQRILRMRKEGKSYLKTILVWVVKQCPYTDEIVCLARILNTLDSAGLTYSRKEVRTAFMTYYNSDYHADKTGYLNWLIKGRKNLSLGGKGCVISHKVDTKKDVINPQAKNKIGSTGTKQDISKAIRGDKKDNISECVPIHLNAKSSSCKYNLTTTPTSEKGLVSNQESRGVQGE